MSGPPSCEPHCAVCKPYPLLPEDQKYHIQEVGVTMVTPSGLRVSAHEGRVTLGLLPGDSVTLCPCTVKAQV
jgi:hypothetical protein